MDTKLGAAERLVVVRISPGSSRATHFSRLAESLGAEVIEKRGEGRGFLERIVREARDSADRALVLDVDSVCEALGPEELESIAALIGQFHRPVLLLASRSSRQVGEALQVLTAGAVTGVSPIPQSARVHFPEESRDLAEELATFNYPLRPEARLGLTCDGRVSCTELMHLDGVPAFLRLASCKAGLFVWATPGVFDPDSPLSAELQFEEVIDSYVPAIIFVRHALGDRCWRTRGMGAGLVIDDPLLSSRYGLLDFPALLSSARANNYHVTLGFIPWNHWRTRTAEAAFFREHSDCFSVCLHGCDHTQGEFASADGGELATRIELAASRMRRHEQRTGIQWEPLLVCPQELFSLAAVRAGAETDDVIALVNTRCIPPASAEARVKGSDLLLAATDVPFGLPLLKRHYLRDMSDFAMSMFLGKPPILAAHHDFFRDGPGPTEAFVRKLREMRPDVTWRPLSAMLQELCSTRRVSATEWETRIFADVFRLHSEAEGATTHHVLRRSTPGTVTAVSAGGSGVEFRQVGDSVRFTVRLEGPGPIDIRIERQPRRVVGARLEEGPTYQLGVAVRRTLSELRDRVVGPGLALVQRASRLLQLQLVCAGVIHQLPEQSVSWQLAATLMPIL